MQEPDIAYNLPANGAAGVPLALSVFADRSHLREQLRDDAEAAGFRITTAGRLAALLDDQARSLGDVVLLDCPVVDPARLAALARLDLRAAQGGTHLVVSTSIEALDDVFACLDQSNPQILVDPSRAERVIALGEVLTRISSLRLRELSEEDRLMLLRLTEQVGQIAQRLERLESPVAERRRDEGDSVFRFAASPPGQLCIVLSVNSVLPVACWAGSVGA